MERERADHEGRASSRMLVSCIPMHTHSEARASISVTPARFDASPALIVIIDADDEMREQLERDFRDSKYQTRGFHAASEALSALARGLRPHLIVLDVVIPAAHDWLFEQRQDTALRNIPVVTLSADTTLRLGSI